MFVRRAGGGCSVHCNYIVDKRNNIVQRSQNYSVKWLEKVLIITVYSFWKKCVSILRARPCGNERLVYIKR
jgi:hypothetical protein